MPRNTNSDSAASNQRRFDSVAEEFIDLSLMPAERELLVRFGPQLPHMHMLDLGVGAGRTGYTFSPLVERYVGLDYSPRMLERAERLLGEDERTELVLGDARDLAQIRAGPAFAGFDLVLFSFCGIDAVGHEDRLRVLTEVRRVLKPGGVFLFSAHSLGTLPLSTDLPAEHWHRESLPRRLYRQLQGIRYAREIRRSNSLLDLETAHRRGWTLVRDPAHDFSLEVYYVDPQTQLTQLHDAGLAAEAVLNRTGVKVSLPYSGRDDWLDFLCRPSGKPTRPGS